MSGSRWQFHVNSWVAKIEKDQPILRIERRGNFDCVPVPEVATAMEYGDSIVVPARDSEALVAYLYNRLDSKATKRYINDSEVRVWKRKR